MFEKSKAAEDSSAMLSMDYAVEFADSMSRLSVQHVELSKEVCCDLRKALCCWWWQTACETGCRMGEVFEAGKRHGRIQEFGQRFLELYVKSWLFEPHTRGKFMNQVSVYKTDKC
jgi:hypothetical protein